MTVAELIERLTNVPQDAPVCVLNIYTADSVPIRTITVDEEGVLLT